MSDAPTPAPAPVSPIPPATQTPDPRFNTDINTSPPGLTVAQLDALFGFIMNSGGGIAGAVVAGIKIAFVTMYLVAREKAQNAWALYTKQKQEQSQTNADQWIVDHDSMGSETKPVTPTPPVVS